MALALIPLLVTARAGLSGPASSPGAPRPLTRLRATIAGTAQTVWSDAPVPPTALPLGDGKLSSSPQIGYEDACIVNFGGGGAQAVGPWIDTTNGTWDLQSKISVQGSVPWPDASNSFTIQGSSRILTTNDLPVDATTGIFPISPSDPAFQYDRNPNSIQTQSLTWTVPATPVAAATPSCLGMGPIGVATNGVVIFNALDAAGRDAGAHEVQDSCSGHPQVSGMYHYHDLSACLQPSSVSEAGSSTLIGYALDGYGIYAERDANGDLPSDADLDACHGITSTVIWDGRSLAIYHYDVTLEYPYFLGCFHGTPVTRGNRP